MDLDIIVQNKKNKILVIGPSSSGKSTLMNGWITKGLANKKEICFAYQYNRIKKYTKRIFHYNLLRCYANHNSSDINTDKLLEKILTIKPLFVYILFTNEEELIGDFDLSPGGIASVGNGGFLKIHLNLLSLQLALLNHHQYYLLVNQKRYFFL